MEISRMSLAELRRLREELEKTVDDKEKQLVSEARKEIDDVLKRYNVTIDQVIGIKYKKTKTGALSLPRYRNPDDFSQTWTGKGRKPRWVINFLKRGGELEDIAIDHESGLDPEE